MPKRPSPGSRQTEILSGATARDRLRIRESEVHKPFFFQSRQRGIDRSDGHVASGACFELAPDRHAVGVVLEMRQRQQHVQFEFPNEITLGHIYSTNAYLDGCRRE